MGVLYEKKYWFVLLITVFANVANAQTCLQYPNRDAATIKELFSVRAIVPQTEIAGGVQGGLNRMNEIAFLGTFTYWQFPTQRLAFKMEYNAWLSAINFLSSNPPATLSPRGKRFVTNVLSSVYNKLKDTKIDGSTEADATSASQAANILIKDSLSELWRCY